MPSMRTGHDGGSWADKGLVGGGSPICRCRHRRRRRPGRCLRRPQGLGWTAARRSRRSPSSPPPRPGCRLAAKRELGTPQQGVAHPWALGCWRRFRKSRYPVSLIAGSHGHATAARATPTPTKRADVHGLSNRLRKSDESRIWRRIGAAWVHEDGEGLPLVTQPELAAGLEDRTECLAEGPRTTNRERSESSGLEPASRHVRWRCSWRRSLGVRSVRRSSCG